MLTHHFQRLDAHNKDLAYPQADIFAVSSSMDVFDRKLYTHTVRNLISLAASFSSGVLLPKRKV
jgi:hypothetical protein